jgi:hypothetical protein
METVATNARNNNGQVRLIDSACEKFGPDYSPEAEACLNLTLMRRSFEKSTTC